MSHIGVPLCCFRILRPGITALGCLVITLGLYYVHLNAAMLSI